MPPSDGLPWVARVDGSLVEQSHWEQRLFMNDVMAPVGSHASIFSALTLAAMEDSGW